MSYGNLTMTDKKRTFAEIEISHDQCFRSEASRESFMKYVEDSMAVFKCPTHDADHVFRYETRLLPVHRPIAARPYGTLPCRVATLAMRIANASGKLSAEQRQCVYIAALCHDLMDSKLAASGRPSFAVRCSGACTASNDRETARKGGTRLSKCLRPHGRQRMRG